jgi:hypothetical protein
MCRAAPILAPTAKYGICACLDAEPELLFRLRKVDAKELVPSRRGQTPDPTTSSRQKGRKEVSYEVPAESRRQRRAKVESDLLTVQAVVPC